MIDKLLKDNLIWFPEMGIGYFPVTEFIYDDNYFNNYKGLSDTDIGTKLVQARISFVSKYFSGEVVDVGIGCGHFILSRKNTLGYDVNPAGIKWLKERNIYFDLYGKKKCDALTFWDSLEHIHNPEKAIRQAKEWVFVSMPIYDDLTHLLKSKHLKKNEHIWYFTHGGLVYWFSDNGFDLVEFTNEETQLGREGIVSYAFKKRKSG